MRRILTGLHHRRVTLHASNFTLEFNVELRVKLREGGITLPLKLYESFLKLCTFKGTNIAILVNTFIL